MWGTGAMETINELYVSESSRPFVEFKRNMLVKWGELKRAF